MASISPLPGQDFSSSLSPIIQNAGRVALPSGTRMRASNFPYAWVNLPFVVSLPDVMSQLP